MTLVIITCRVRRRRNMKKKRNDDDWQRRWLVSRSIVSTWFTWLGSPAVSLPVFNDAPSGLTEEEETSIHEQRSSLPFAAHAATMFVVSLSLSRARRFFLLDHQSIEIEILSRAFTTFLATNVKSIAMRPSALIKMVFDEIKQKERKALSCCIDHKR